MVLELYHEPVGLKEQQGFCMYTSYQEDRLWASLGLVATVDVIPLGGDRVFLQFSCYEDIMQVFNDAINFFGMLFNNLHKWMLSDVLYERGAWVRVYCTLVNVWNVDFFKVCVSCCGRFIMADECTLDKERLDYACILISTKSLEVLNSNFVLLIDGCQYVVKLVEEWGCCIGEDAFLTEEGPEPPSQSHHNNEGLAYFVDHGMDDDHGDVEAVIQDIYNEWRTQAQVVVESKAAC